MKIYAVTFLLLFVLAATIAPSSVIDGTENSNEDVEFATNVVFQSTDGGATWQDISRGLPELEQPIGFFAGASDVYLSTKGALYHSKSNLKSPVWEKENVPGAPRTSVAFNRFGTMAFTYDGHIYRKDPLSGPDSDQAWLPIYTSLITHSVATVFETSNGTLFMGTGRSLSKSFDKALSWKPVHKGWVDNIRETEDGVLLATGQQGIMRSTDKGENWEWVISEGGVGIALERIEGGFAAITYNGASKSRRVRVSYDGGLTWEPIDTGLPPSPLTASIVQSGEYLFCGHPDGIFRSSDKGKTWKLLRRSIDEKVFNLAVSGNVVYAIPREGGC